MLQSLLQLPSDCSLSHLLCNLGEWGRGGGVEGCEGWRGAERMWEEKWEGKEVEGGVKRVCVCVCGKLKA